MNEWELERELELEKDKNNWRYKVAMLLKS